MSVLYALQNLVWHSYTQKAVFNNFKGEGVAPPLNTKNKMDYSKIETTLKNWKLSLLNEVDISSLYSRNKVAHKWKAPYRCLVIRELISWRLQDILSQTLQLSKLRMIVGARILLRSSIETLCVLIYLNQKMKAVLDEKEIFPDFDTMTIRLMLGAKNDQTLPDPINILTIISKSDKSYPGLEEIFKDLSETAHPNYDGMVLGYAFFDKNNYITKLGDKWVEMFGNTHISGMKMCINIFKKEYNEIWPKLFAELENWLVENDKNLEGEQTMAPKEIAREAIKRMNKKITNEIFLIIQNDRDLMKEYLKAVEDGKLDTVNQAIGKEIKNIYGFINVNDREDNPSCTLIQSHQKFE